MTEPGQSRTWSFPEGSVGQDDSVKGYDVEGKDGPVGHERRTCRLNVTAAEVKATPTHESPEAPVDWGYVDQFERGMIGGGFVWPYTDV